MYKVALFGVTGCGKSSIINLLAGKPMANVSEGVEACTRRARWYPVTLGEKKFQLWDTMGFNQAEAKDINPLSPYEQAHALLRNLQEGVDLILLCARKDGINASLRNLYWLLDSFFFSGRAQIALVLTHFDTPHDQWWERNRNTITQKYGIPVQSLPYACITTIQNGSPQSDYIYDQSKHALKTLLEDHATPPTPTPLRLDLSSDTASAAAVESLNVHCQLSLPDATTLVEKFKLPKRPFRVILFGEAGAGKSSIINLIVGHPVAETSSGIGSCTLASRSHKINTGLHQFMVWDTVGLNGMQIGHDIKTMENAAHLVRDLHRQGGIDLLVFCKKSGRFMASECSSLRVFQEYLCEGQIPVAFIITHLESEDPMEKWWETNGEDLVKATNLKPSAVAGHACITSLPSGGPDDQKHQDKLLLSRELVQALLEDSVSYSNFDKDEGAWVMSFLRKLVGMIKVGNPAKKEKITIKNLMSRCELSKVQAEELHKLLYT